MDQCTETPQKTKPYLVGSCVPDEWRRSQRRHSSEIVMDITRSQVQRAYLQGAVDAFPLGFDHSNVDHDVPQELEERTLTRLNPG